MSEVQEQVVTTTQRKIDYKFGVYAGNTIISERIFDADVYNPANRYKIDLRPFNSQIISDFRNILESPSQYLNFKHQVGFNQRNQPKTYRLNEYTYPSKHEDYALDSFKYALKISDSASASDYFIIERSLNLKRLNKESITSKNIVEKVDEWANEIRILIQERDQKQMWDEYDLINKASMSIGDIRSLSSEQKEDMLFQVNKR